MAVLVEAVRSGDVGRVKRLLKGGLFQRSANPNEKSPTGRTALHEAAERGLVEATRLLLAKGASAIACDLEGVTPLHVAAEHGRLEVAQLLLIAGADPNAKDPYHRTPLHYAAEFGHASVARLLLDKGADPNAHAGEEQFTPLHEAALRGHLEVAEALVDHRAPVNALDLKGHRPLYYAVRENHQLLAEYLRRNRAQE